MTRLMNCLSRFLYWLCILVMAAMASMVITSVALRYFLRITYVWSEEAITMLFISTTYFGAILGVKENEHISVDYLLEAVPKGVRNILKIIIIIIVILVQVVLFKYSLTWIEKVGNVLTPGLRVPIRYFYYLMPFSSILIIIYELFQLRCHLPGKPFAQNRDWLNEKNLDA